MNCPSGSQLRNHSNLTVDEWLSIFDDPILGNSTLYRLANASYQIVIEGASYRERVSTHRALLSNQGATVDVVNRGRSILGSMVDRYEPCC